MKDWMYFKTGSYWIYEEEMTGAIDTITVWEDWEGVAQDVNDAFYSYTLSSFDGYFYRYTYNSSFSIHCLSTPECDCEKVERSKSRPGDFVGAEKNLIFPVILGNYSYPSTGITSVSEIIDGYEVVSGDTASVAVFDVEEDSSEAGQNTVYYLSKGIGIVRRELEGDGLIWNLTEYNVIQ